MSSERAVSGANKSGETAERRRYERNGAAVIRALGRSPRAEYRARQLEIDDTPIGIATPYLLPQPDASEESSTGTIARGVFDAIGVRLRYSDAEVFAANEPDDLVARIVFDMLEQLRCESLVPDELEGTRQNMDRAYREWCRAETLSATAIGLLLFTVMQMVRSRLIAPIHDELIEDQIESTRALISPIIGTALKGLRDTRSDQQAYVVPALSMAEAIADMVTDESTETSAVTVAAAALFVPPEWGNEEPDEGDHLIGIGETPTQHADRETLETIGGYHVFTRAHDVERRGVDLYSPEKLRELRVGLDEQIAAQSVSAFTLARRLQRLFVGLSDDGWRHGEEEGLVDAARLGQVIANPANRAVFRQRRYRPVAPAVVSFLIDNSGSMKRQRHQSVTVLVDTLARALDLAGATSEVLGFTTNAWNGGEPLREWRRADEPHAPGRLAEQCHIVYKDADTPWKQSRRSVAAMMRTQHFREGIDGEAIAWAYQRLLARPEPRKALIVFSDGAPMEAATINANGEAFLESHLRSVVQRIERAGLVQLGAVTIDQSVDMIFSKSVHMDLTGTLALGEYRLLERLFSTRR